MIASKFTKKEIRTWALILAAIFTAIGGIQYFFWAHSRAAAIFWILAGVFLTPGLLFPQVLKPVYKVWLKFAAVLAWFNTRLILAIAFFLVFTPVGLIMRLFGKDMLKEKWDKDARSYWINRTDEAFDRSRYEKQY